MKKLILPAFLLFGACTEIQSATDKAGRDAAKSVLPETLAVYFPQVPKAFFTPFTDCVVDFALAKEVQALAADAVTGVDQGTADVVTGILARPETQNCLRGKIEADQIADVFPGAAA